ncbi:MAG: ZPR1 zinc finger domain-containing protein [Thermoproteales archaeon]|nr:ZPR1 zinc finger domain-containing protein [Thermoproteales archaeon]
MGEGEAAYYAEEVYEFEMECPYCGAPMQVREVVYRMPRIGRTLLVSKRCPTCGYRRSEVVPLEARGRVRVYYRVEGARDLYARVIRSNVASIEVPELGASITPGAAAPMVVTNIEGILRLFLEAVKSLEVMGEDVGDAEEELRRLAEEGGRFTLVLDDPLGISSVEPPKGVRRSGKVIVERVEGALEPETY